jgi:glycosyltransferase involved in cell wall biosynthesis
MRILVVSQYFWPENFRINDLVAELVRRGHEVTVLTGVPNYPGGQMFPEFAKDRSAFEAYRGAAVVRVPLVVRGSGRGMRLIANYATFALSASVLGAWRLRRCAADVIFVFEPSPITVGLPAVLLSRLKRARFALWVLDLWPETLAALGVVRSKRLLAAVSKMVGFIYDRCALILVQSRAFIPAVLSHSTRADAAQRTHYFPSWSEALLTDRSASPAPEVPWRPDLFTIVFAGNVGEAQDFPAILAAAEQLKDDPRIRWVVVGDGRASRWVESEVARRGLADTVLLVGRFPLERMPSFFRHASALLVTLRPDPVFSMTIPGKVQSYLEAGIPILAMLDGEGARVVEESGAGLVCASGDARGLAGAVLRLAALGEKERTTMGRQGALYSAREFDRDELISRLEAALEAIRSPATDPSQVESQSVAKRITAADSHGPDA